MPDNKKINEWISSRKKRLDSLTADELFPLIVKGDKQALSSSITLIENTNADAQKEGRTLIEKCTQLKPKSWRIGITGVPGVGKSTFIEAFGKIVLDAGHRLAVLAIDPSSNVSGGSILGDKTRMDWLSRQENAFIRPTAAGENLGGVARNSRDALLLCESAGFDVIFIETVGVGQSETMVHDMVDYFLLLMLSGAGDELQGMKRGIMELADTLLITKADSGNERKSDQARREYANAVHLFPPKKSEWITNVLTTSSVTGEGLNEAWNNIESYFNQIKSNGFYESNRMLQDSRFLKSNLTALIINDIEGDAALKKYLQKLESEIREGKTSNTSAVEKLYEAYLKAIKKRR
jgi:LAO/AO transport system kinase